MKMSGAMMRFVEVVKHYPGQQQVNLSVEIEVPGSWFGGTEMGVRDATPPHTHNALITHGHSHPHSSTNTHAYTRTLTHQNSHA